MGESTPKVPGYGQPIDEQQAVEFKAKWDAWHKRVAALIYTRFNQAAQKLFKKSPSLRCQIGYMIASDGRVGQVRVMESSSNAAYDGMIISIIKSIEHDPILEFPAGSMRKFTEKSGTFTWNFQGSISDTPQDFGPGFFALGNAKMTESASLLVFLQPTGPDPAVSSESWNAWQTRLQEELCARLNKLNAGTFTASEASCEVSYRISRDGSISFVNVVRPSLSPKFDEFVVNTIKSLAKDPLLAFPLGCDKRVIERSGTYSWSFANRPVSVDINQCGDFGESPKPHIGPERSQENLPLRYFGPKPEVK